MFYNLHTFWQFVLLVSGLAVFASIARKKPVWGGWLIIFFTPLYLVKIGSWPLAVLEALIWIFALTWLIVAEEIKEEFSAAVKNDLFWPILLILSGIIVSTLFSPDQKVGLGILKSWFLAPMIFALIFKDVLQDERAIKVFFSALFASGAAVAAISAGYLFLGRLTFDGRLAAFYLSPNHLSMFLAPCLLAGFGLYSETKNNWQRGLLFAGYCLLLIILYFTYSYGAWLGLAAAAVFALFCFWKYKIINRKQLFAVSCLLPIAFFIVFSFQIYGANSDKLAALIFSPRSSWQSRLMIWRAAGKILKDNWIFGVGPGMFQQYYLAYQKYFPVPYLEWAVPQPQNIFLAWWLQAGLLGIVGFIWLLIMFFRRGFELVAKIKSPPAVFLMAVMIYILIHGLADTTFWKNDLALIFWIIIFLSCKAGRRAY